MVVCLIFLTARSQSNTCNPPLTDIHYTRYTVGEVATYLQTNSSGPVLAYSNAYEFEGVVSLKTNYSAASAELILPDNTLLQMGSEGMRTFAYLDQFTNFADLTAAFPSGDYQFVVSNEITTVPVPSGGTLPNAPALSDYAAAQFINPTEDFTLKWNAFSGGKSKDVIDVDIIGSGLSSPAFGCPGALNGLATSFVIPANTLTSNETYTVRIEFVDVLTLDTNSTPFVALLAGVESFTDARIATLGPNSAPTLLNAAVLADGSVRFDVSTIPGTVNVIQYTASLAAPISWTPLLTTNSASGTISFTNKPAGSTAFYRVVEP